MFKKMAVQKRRELLKEYEKQEKRLRELKSKALGKMFCLIAILFFFTVPDTGSGTSKKKAEAKQKEALTRKQEKNRTKMQKNDEDQVRSKKSR